MRLSLANLKELQDDAIVPLAGHPGLGRLSLLNGLKLSDAALEPLERVPALVDLDLSYCRRLRDAAVTRLIRARPLLRRLSLASCEKTRDGTLVALGELTDLRDLRLHLCRGVTATGIAALSRAPLDRLDLGFVLSSARARALAPLAPTLRHLVGDEADRDDPLDEEGVGALASLARLETLILSRQRLTDAAVARLARLTRLRALDLSYMTPSLKGAGLLALRDLPLCTLQLQGQRGLLGDALAELPPTLERLGLRYTSVGSGALTSFARLERLRELDLGGVEEVDDEALERFASFPRLQRLDVGGCKKLTSAGIARLVAAPVLRQLRLSNGVIDDATRKALQARGCEVVH